MLSLVPSLLLSFASGPGYNDGAKSGVCFTGCSPYACPTAPLHGPRAQTPPVSVPVTRRRAHQPIVHHLAQPVEQTPCPSWYTEPPFPTWSGMVEKMAGDCKLLVHLGDTKGGSGPCNDTLMAEPIRIMIRSGAPVLYTLGDNEATDCHRMLSRSDMTAQGGVVGSSSAAAAAMYPVAAEYLTAESARSHMISEFFSDLTTDLTGTLAVDTHSAACPFNSMVVVDHMLVATIEMPGSNFGLSVEPNMDLVDPVASHQMMYDRANACNMEWITAAAKKAADHHIKAVLIGFQAAWWDVALVGTGSKSAAARHVAYEPFLQKMLEVTAAYPDIMFYTVHADSHFWLSFSPSNIQNWVNLMVEGSDRALYSYAKFTHDPNAEFDPLTVKEVHTKMSEQEAASYGR